MSIEFVILLLAFVNSVLILLILALCLLILLTLLNYSHLNRRAILQIFTMLEELARWLERRAWMRQEE